MKILVTGFDPFDQESINPSIEAVKQLPDQIDDAQIFKLEIPTVMQQSSDKIIEKMNEINPDVILSVGQERGRADLSIERVAININDFRIPDNQGNQPIDAPIVKNGADAYFSTLPIKAMLKACLDNDIPASISNTAGTFVCNEVMYLIAHTIKTQQLNIRSGFIHIPAIPQQVHDKPGIDALELQTIVKGLELCLKAIIHHYEDIEYCAGREF